MDLPSVPNDVQSNMDTTHAADAEPADHGMMDGFSHHKLPNLLQMPHEILLHLFSFIDAEYLVDTVSNVCRDLRHIITDENYWKIRLFQTFPKPYPIIEEPHFSWMEACKHRESCKKTWKSGKLEQKLITLNKTNGCAVDTVHLTKDNQFCICGGRDRSITVWKLNNESGPIHEATCPGEIETQNLMQHNGWVWSITSFGDELCSTSFDNTVKFWDIGALSNKRGVKASINTGSPVLCSSYLDSGVVVVGCFNKKMLLLDSRSGTVVQDLMFHKRSVLCVESNDNVITTAGEDGLLFIIDKRKNDVLHEVKTGSFCMAMDLHDHQIWTGAKDGTISVYDTHDPTDIILATTLDYGYEGKITGLRYTQGAVYSGSTDGWMKIFEPSHDPEPIASIELKRCGGITDIFTLDKTLAVSTGEGLVALWRPELEATA